MKMHIEYTLSKYPKNGTHWEKDVWHEKLVNELRKTITKMEREIAKGYSVVNEAREVVIWTCERILGE